MDPNKFHEVALWNQEFFYSLLHLTKHPTWLEYAQRGYLLNTEMLKTLASCVFEENEIPQDEERKILPPLGVLKKLNPGDIKDIEELMRIYKMPSHDESWLCDLLKREKETKKEKEKEEENGS